MSEAFLEMPKVQFLDRGEVRLAYYEAGPRTGPPVVLCHGFPETAFSWRRQIKALADAGRWVIAPDQRGYGLTGGPSRVEAYDLEHLTSDLTALLDHVGAEGAIFCGHDWGGAVVWDLARRHPARVRGVVGVNTPFTPRAPADPMAILKARFGEDMYMVHFQRPLEADAILARDVRKTLSFFFRRPPAGAGAPGGGLAGPKSSGGSTFALVKMVEAYDPAADARATFLAPEEMDVYVAAFERTGFTGGINWYRNITRNWAASEGLEDRVAAPALMIMAERDAVLPPSAADGMEVFVPDLEKVLVTGSGHWTQQEEPEQTTLALRSWLDRRFPL